MALMLERRVIKGCGSAGGQGAGSCPPHVIWAPVKDRHPLLCFHTSEVLPQKRLPTLEPGPNLQRGRARWCSVARALGRGSRLCCLCSGGLTKPRVSLGTFPLCPCMRPILAPSQLTVDPL